MDEKKPNRLDILTAARDESGATAKLLPLLDDIGAPGGAKDPLEEHDGLLGIDRDRPETAEHYDNMEITQFLKEAMAARVVTDLLNGGVSPATIARVLERHKRPSIRGRRPEGRYRLAFERVYIAQSHTLNQAFAAMLDEERIEARDESDRSDMWNAFRQAMKRQKKISH